MASERQSLKLVRGTLLATVLLAALAAALDAGTAYFRGERLAEFKAEQLRFRGISQRYLSLDDEKRIIGERYPQFVELYDAGVIGRERRLDWLEAVRLAGEAAELEFLDVRMETQQPMDPGFPLPNGTFELRGSRMRLTMAMVHEGDLVRFFAALQRSVTSQFSVESCALTRSEQNFSAARVARNIEGRCDLLWYTLNTPGDEDLAIIR